MRPLPLLLAALLLAAAPAPASASQAADPFEGLNRRIHGFNQVVRDRVLDPAVAAYVARTTPGFRAGVANAFANLREPITAASLALAGEFDQSLNAAARFGINSSLGLGGVQDPATALGYPRRDFAPADTACAWGVPRGPFMMLPLLGPSTLRDAGALLATGATLSAALGAQVVLPWRGGEALVAYAEAAPELARTDATALDSYALYRSAYLQRRAASCATDRAAESGQD